MRTWCVLESWPPGKPRNYFVSVAFMGSCEGDLSAKSLDQARRCNMYAQQNGLPKRRQSTHQVTAGTIRSVAMMIAQRQTAAP
eukprot:CAMPEP_0185159996 /NCGR_PEP_ID=MMETSP1139-20130426/3387_1 /TAXON_ID=298111 /ORGANISM="Pavlova sp., Strain CCMP459" /LENGTH=82 /DNA_ID=CAMNT_0027725187 /DNA_START=214 /DNA_END=465 /DNA_ORIENTATION=-